jgi:predicted PurR-regulated permease PerM
MAVIGVLAAVVFLVVPPIVQQTAKFIDSAPTLVREMSNQWRGLGNLIEKYHIQPQIDQAVAAIQADAGRFARDLGGNFISGIGSAFGWMMAATLTLVLTFLMLIEGPTWLNRLWSVYKDDKKITSHKRLLGKMHAVVEGYVGGQLTVSGIDGLFAGLTVFILSQFFPEVPSNLALPTVAMLFTLSLIPLFGAPIGAMVITLLLLINSVPAAVIFAIYFLIYSQIEGNFIAPTIQSRRIELCRWRFWPPLLSVFMSLALLERLSLSPWRAVSKCSSKIIWSVHEITKSSSKNRSSNWQKSSVARISCSATNAVLTCIL